jgi:acyl dehydratase
VSDTEPGAERLLTEAEVITDEVRAWIGRASEPLTVPEEITAGDVRRYVEATGDRNPLWLDDEAARAAGYRARVVPPMMVIGMSWRLGEGGRLQHQVPLPEIYSDTRNADAEIEWLDATYIGDRLTLLHRLTNIVAKRGSRGLGVYLTRETEYRAQDGRLVARTRQTVVRLPRREVR